VIKLQPDRTVLKLDAGDRIRLTAQRFERLAQAFFADVDTKFAAEA
jgi:hypothetical protein